VGEPVTLPRSPIAKRSAAPSGSWWINSRLGVEAGDAAVVSVKCPHCARASSLRIVDTDGTAEGHDIASDGTVSPSVVCPYPDCAWHTFVRLADWSGAVA
jgi:hypothetical protein